MHIKNHHDRPLKCFYYVTHASEKNVEQTHITKIMVLIFLYISKSNILNLFDIAKFSLPRTCMHLAIRLANFITSCEVYHR